MEILSMHFVTSYKLMDGILAEEPDKSKVNKPKKFSAQNLLKQ